MSRSFFIFYAFFGIYGIISIFSKEIKSILIGIVEIITAVCLGIYHNNISEDSYTHRKFPHTFTFGIVTSFILLIFTSFPIFIIGLTCFCLHIIEDGHVKNALERDIALWKSFPRTYFFVR